MAIQEQICWEVLDLLHGERLLKSWLNIPGTDDPSTQNAAPLFVIEEDLVLRHSKNEIEDSLYFLEKRGYLVRHGFTGLTRVALQLSDSALEVLETRRFSEEEQQAFKEAILDLKKPGWFGMSFNIGEVIRRFKKPKI